MGQRPLGSEADLVRVRLGQRQIGPEANQARGHLGQRNIMAPDYGKMKIAELKEHWLRESIGLERALARREYWLGESMGSDS